MNPPLTLPPADERRRLKAAQLIESMRAQLASLEFYLQAVPALPGDYWASVLEDAELATIRAVRAACHDGSSNLSGRHK